MQALDFTKGVLVVFMVLYHAFNYSTEYHLGFRYLAFLPPSFILITGFLIARVYFQRLPSRDGASSVRMVVRGLKLLVIFTLLNVTATVLGARNYNGHVLDVRHFFANWMEVYLTGSSRLAAFEVLVPIAYILLTGPLLLWLHRRSNWIVPALAGCLVGGLALLEATGWGVPGNVSMMVAGFIGAALGGVPQSVLKGLDRFWFVPLAGYAVVAGFAYMTGAFGRSVLVQQLAAGVAVAALYGIGAHFRIPEWLMRRVEVLGNYSLLSYIAQIGFLQVLVRGLDRPDPDSLAFAIFFVAVLVLTALVAEITRCCRVESRLADGAYRLVFA